MDYDTQLDEDSSAPAKLFVGQIPKDVTESTLSGYFDEFGTIKEVSIIRDSAGASRGCAFVTFFKQSAAILAVQNLHDKVKLTHSINPLQVRFAETQIERENKLFVGMLPKTFTEQDLHEIFSPYGEIKEVHIIRGPEGSPKGCAFVKFVDRDAANTAINDLNETIPNGATRPLVVKFAENKKQSSKNKSEESEETNNISTNTILWYGRDLPPNASFVVDNTSAMTANARHIFPPFTLPSSVPAIYDISSIPFSSSFSHQVYSPVAGRQIANQELNKLNNQYSHSRPPEGPTGANLFIYHLPRDLTDADLATLFAPFGNVISAKVFVDKKTSDSKGFGFVSYDSFDSAKSAIDSMNGFQIGTKRLKVQHKRIGTALSGVDDESQQMGNVTAQYSGFESRASENKQFQGGGPIFEYRR